MPRNVGSVQIVAEIDTTSLDRGILRIEMGLDKVKGKISGFQSDLSRTSIAAIGVSNAFADMAVNIGTSMVSMAAGAPAVAGAMAKMDVQADRLQRTLGSALSPVFDTFAEIFTAFVGGVEANQDKIALLSEVFVQLYEDIQAVIDLVKDPIEIIIKYTMPGGLGEVAEAYAEGGISSPDYWSAVTKQSLRTTLSTATGGAFNILWKFFEDIGIKEMLLGEGT